MLGKVRLLRKPCGRRKSELTFESGAQNWLAALINKERSDQEDKEDCPMFRGDGCCGLIEC